MQGVEYNGHEKLTPLELVLQLHGEFRRSLEPIRVTPLQAGVLLYLCRHEDATLTHVAATLYVRPATVCDVIRDLVRKRWITKHRSLTDLRVVHLRLSRQGQVLMKKIESHLRRVSMEVAANKIITAAGLKRVPAD